MSKRDQGAAVGDYPRQGFVAPALVNFLALLGWSSKTEEEIFSLEELTQRFSLEAVNRSPARFDAEKCAWVNQQHLMRMSANAFAAAAKPYVEEAGLATGEQFIAVASAVQEKVRLLTEVSEAVRFLLEDAVIMEESAWAKMVSTANVASILDALGVALADVNEWSGDTAKAAIATAATAVGVKAGQMMFPLRVALSGKAGGPDLAVILQLLGRERCLSRIRSVCQRLS
jgi:glutamyl-tRNA synthetase